MAKRADIIACARTYIGTPFQHQGRIKGRAMDCVGLVLCVGKELGLSVPDYPLNYDPEPTDDTVLRECKKYLREILVEQMQPGDVACMDVGGRVVMPSHTCIISPLAPGVGIIHAYNWIGKVCEHTLDKAWRDRIVAVFQFPGLED